MLRPAPRATLFPYTTLFRSSDDGPDLRAARRVPDRNQPAADRSPADLLAGVPRSEEHTSELQSHSELVCRLLLANKNMQLARESDAPKTYEGLVGISPSTPR